MGRLAGWEHIARYSDLSRKSLLKHYDTTNVSAYLKRRGLYLINQLFSFATWCRPENIMFQFTLLRWEYLHTAVKTYAGDQSEAMKIATKRPFHDPANMQRMREGYMRSRSNVIINFQTSISSAGQSARLISVRSLDRAQHRGPFSRCTITNGIFHKICWWESNMHHLLIGRWYNGITLDFDSSNGGSLPSRPTISLMHYSSNDKTYVLHAYDIGLIPIWCTIFIMPCSSNELGLVPSKHII